jgi:hypothetical protein
MIAKVQGALQTKDAEKAALAKQVSRLEGQLAAAQAAAAAAAPAAALATSASDAEKIRILEGENVALVKQRRELQEAVAQLTEELATARARAPQAASLLPAPDKENASVGKARCVAVSMRKRPTPTRDCLQGRYDGAGAEVGSGLAAPAGDVFDRSPSKKRGVHGGGDRGGGAAAAPAVAAPVVSAGDGNDAATPLVAADAAPECNVQ